MEIAINTGTSMEPEEHTITYIKINVKYPVSA